MQNRTAVHAPSWAWIFAQFCGIVLISFATCIPVHAAQPNGMLYASGAVTVNRNPVNRLVAVFAGDIITTGMNATATIVSNGSSLSVPPNSTIVYGKTAATPADKGKGHDGGEAKENHDEGGDGERQCEGDECKQCKGDDKEDCECKVSEEVGDHDGNHNHEDGQNNCQMEE
jgi:hypothetical protein